MERPTISLTFWRRLCVLLCLLGCAAPLVHAEKKSDRDFTRLKPAEFAQLPEANAVIDLEHFDQTLLAAAIFHETNNWRAKLGLRPFRHSPALDTAADVQVTYGSLMLEIGHTNFMPGQKTAMDRVQKVGLIPGTVAENVALTPLLDADDDTVVGLLGEGDKRRYVDAATGRELKAHTYATFAKRVLAQWMNSPHHRENIVARDLKFLGCSARSKRDIGGSVGLYAVQEFFSAATF